MYRPLSRSVRQSNVIDISTFYGLDETEYNSSDINISKGFSPDMRNWAVTKEYKLSKRQGIKILFSSLGPGKIQGMWYGTIAGEKQLVFAHSGKLYKRVNDINTEIGALTDNKVGFFMFNDKLYIYNGVEYKVYDGISLSDVEGKIPTLTKGTSPEGGGTSFEEINLLTPKFKQSFNGDGATKVYKLLFEDLDQDEVLIESDTNTLVENTDFTVNRVTGEVTFNVAPSNLAVDNTIITASKTHNKENEILKCSFHILYGGRSETRVFLSGNTDYINRVRYCNLNDPTYWPDTNFDDVGSDEYPVTDFSKHYSTLLIHKTNETYYTVFELDDNNKAQFPTFPLNDKKGSLGPVSQLINNNPITVTNTGIYEWISTNIRDERNANLISDKINPSLLNEDLSKAVTFDYEREGEYWVVIDSTAWVMNYNIRDKRGEYVWYKHTNIDASCFIEIDGILYYGTEGAIYKLEGEDDIDQPIDAYWEGGSLDLGDFSYKKDVKKVYLSIKPETRSTVVYTFESDELLVNQEYEANYDIFDWEDIDFNRFSFISNPSPKPKPFKAKAKKVTYIKPILKSNELGTTATVLGIKIEFVYKSKNK